MNKEQIVIEKIRSGISEELETIYLKYRDEFITWLPRFYTCSYEEAKDIYQFAIITFYDNILNSKLTELTSTIKTYIFSIGKYKALEINKKNQRFQLVAASIVQNHEQEESYSEELDSQLEIMESALVALGNPCKELLQLYYYKRKSMEEITVEMGYKNSDTVKNQKYKCLQRLRKMYNSKSPDLVN